MLKHPYISPGRIVLASILATIACGALLLNCGWAQRIPIAPLDCFFTATSSVCVTGLATVPLDSFSTAGHVVILLLMQIGAIGLITFTVFFLALFLSIGLSTKSVAGEALDLSSGQHPRTVAMFTIIFTLCIELLGWIICFFCIKNYYPFSKALFYSLFHAIASFCGAGMSLLPLTNSPFASMVQYSLLTTTALLVLIGGLGFIVWREVFVYLRTLPTRKHVHLSLHTHLVFTVSAILVSTTTLLLLGLEYRPLLQHTLSLQPFFEALFNAICLRSAGFTTLSMSTIHTATLFIIMMVSFIGSSPGSTGSGIKTTTFAIVVSAIKATLLRRNAVEAEGRTIPNDQVFKAMAICALSIAWVSLIAFLLFITESAADPFDLLFEAFSSFTNLGLTRGVTPSLSHAGKYVVISSMILGRIGSLTVLLALKKQSKLSQKLHYPEERVFIG